MVNEFRKIFESTFKSKKIMCLPVSSSHVLLCKNDDLSIEFIHDYRFDEVGINLINNLNGRSINIISALKQIHGNDYRNVIVMLEAYRERMFKTFNLLKSDEDENILFIYLSKYIIEHEYESIKKLVQEMGVAKQ